MVDFHRVLEGVAPGTRAELAARQISKRFAAGQDLMRVDEPLPGAYRLRSGRVRCWRPLSDGRVLTLVHLSRGSVVGIVGVARDAEASTTVTATEPVEAELWPIATLRRLLAVDPGFARNLLGMVADYSMMLMHKLDDSMAPAEQRLGRALLRLASEHGDWREPAKVALTINRQELADLTGLTQFTVSRTLSEWQRRGVVRSLRGRVEITDPHALAEIAEVENMAS